MLLQAILFLLALKTITQIERYGWISNESYFPETQKSSLHYPSFWTDFKHMYFRMETQHFFFNIRS